ncbi:MAG: chromosomal replication initiator protein DnaA [Candidatus Hydrogenedentota bacterium]
MEISDVWQKLNEQLRELLSKHTYQTYFSTLKPHSLSNNILYIKTDNAFLKDWLTEHYKEIVDDCLLKTFSKEISANFICENTSTTITTIEPETPQYVKTNKKFFSVYTFENFIIGESNQFAYASCKSVASKPAKTYNPLLIYAGSGLGKTHLLQAIANKILETNKDAKVIYLTSERFINEYIDSLAKHKIKAFQYKYRNAEVLLIDDIHFLAGKTRSQEEFFHTFNTLYESKCQIVMTSDRPPRDIKELEERLRTRLEWGLIADIQPPSLETRIAILKSKLKNLNVKIPDSVLEFISQNVYSNIRELESALLKIIAASNLTNKEINLENSKNILKDLIKTENSSQSTISIDNIKQRVSKYFNISVNDLLCKKRSKNLVLPRHIAMYLSRKLTPYSLPELGQAFGGKDHVTILHAHKKILSLIDKDIKLRQDIHNLEQSLK